jgi:glutamate-ammonia-ligase adenylyltransferase
MALTRARVVAGPEAFTQRVEAAIQVALTHPRDAQKLKDDVLSMRRRIEKEKGATSAWEVKQVPGGLIDIEFIAQYLMLLHGPQHPELFSTNATVALQRVKDAGFLDAGAADSLAEASKLYQGLTQLLRLAIDDAFRPADAPRGLAELLLRVGDAPDLSNLEALLADTQKRTREIFTSVVGEVAERPVSA